MDRLIEYLAHKLYDITQRHVRWGSISLPRGCQLNFRIDGKCYLEVVESGGVVRTSEIDIVDEYGWLKPEDLEEEIWGVFEGIEFTNKQVNRHLKSIGV